MKLSFSVSVPPLALLLASAFAGGCTAQVDPRDPIGVTSQGIAGGTPIDPTTLGIVQYVNSEGACTGTLVRNNWVLTAAHCWNGSWDQVVGSNTVSLQGQTVNVLGVYPHTDDTGSIDTAQVDVMLLRLDAPIAMNGSQTGWSRALASAQALPEGQQLYCYGYGGTNMVGIYPELTYTDDEYKIEINDNLLMSSGNAAASHFIPGDSGGPCLSGANGPLVGVISGYSPLSSASGGTSCLSYNAQSCADASTSSDALKAWMSDTISGYRGEPIDESQNLISYMFPLQTVNLVVSFPAPVGPTDCTGLILNFTPTSTTILTTASCAVGPGTTVYYYSVQKGATPVSSVVLPASVTPTVQAGVVCNPYVAGSFPSTCYAPNATGSGTHYADLAVFTIPSPPPPGHQPFVLGPRNGYTSVRANTSWEVGTGGTQMMQWAPTILPGANDSTGSFGMWSYFGLHGDVGGPVLQLGKSSTVLLGLLSTIGNCSGVDCNEVADTFTSALYPDNYDWLIKQGAYATGAQSVTVFGAAF